MNSFLAAALLLDALGPQAVPAAVGIPKWAVAIMPSGADYSLEIAADAASRERGYMFREKVGPREGMLFIFDHSGRYGFWMKNCKASLDILWLDERLRIVDMALNRPPCPEDGNCPSIEPIGPSRYVLEFAAGVAVKHKLKRGDRIFIVSEPAIP